MNIQTNLDSMSTLEGKKASRDQTDGFMDKLRRKFYEEHDSPSS